MATIGLTIAKKLATKLWDRHDRNKNAAPKAAKKPMSPLNKLRIPIAFTMAIIGIAWLLSFLLVFAGSKPGMLEEYHVVTLNVSRIGEGIQQNLTTDINRINFDDLHIDLKRSVPVNVPVTMTAAPTTMITISPRDISDSISSLTDKAGDEVKSAKSAAESKASQVKSKASSAANAAESGVNSSIDKAADKLKASLRDVVDKAFAKLTDLFELKDFYSMHLMTVCEGNYTKSDGKDAKEHKQVTSCKDTKLNPLVYVAVFYWVGIVFTGIGFVFGLKIVWRPTERFIKWANRSLIAGSIGMALGSAIAHGVANTAENIVDFVGNGISIEAKTGARFISTTWAATFMLLSAVAMFSLVQWRVHKHPDVYGFSGPSIKPTISPPSAPVGAIYTGGPNYELHNIMTPPAVPSSAHHGGRSEYASSHHGGRSNYGRQTPYLGSVASVDTWNRRSSVYSKATNAPVEPPQVHGRPSPPLPPHDVQAWSNLHGRQ